MKPIVSCLLRSVVIAIGMVPGLLAAAPDYVELHAADGKRSFAGRPVAVVSLEKEVVRIDRKEGGEQDCKLITFAEEDRAQLKRWMERVANDPQTVLNERLVAAETPAILCVGNSYSFRVPKVFEKIAKAEGRNVYVEQVTKGGWTLAQHAGSKETLAKIASRKWDVVVIQEQSLIPAFPPGQRDARMLPPLKLLVAEIERAGALPALYQTWGRRDGDRQNAAAFPNDTFATMNERLSACFKAIRHAVPTLTGVPVGDAWAARMKADKGAALYAKDGSHPSAQGNYLAAAVFYSALYNAPVKHAPGEIGDAAVLNRLAARLGCHQLPAYPLPEQEPPSAP
ncbi:MAG: SGNH/GDSL hydrolase family protein [Akkermansiaceae bacterium]|nr:SGNH/GDSL hydrolase family protein [Akkermansiaceae bacterium]